MSRIRRRPDAQYSRLRELELENSKLRDQVADLKSQLDKVVREGKQQAAPFRKPRDQRKPPEEHKKPGQKPGHTPLMPVPQEAPPRKTTVKEYERQQRSKPVELAVEDSQLGFGPDGPVQVIEVEDTSIQGIPEDQRELVSETVTHRLAQRSPSQSPRFRGSMHSRRGPANPRLCR